MEMAFLQSLESVKVWMHYGGDALVLDAKRGWSYERPQTWYAWKINPSLRESKQREAVSGFTLLISY